MFCKCIINGTAAETTTEVITGVITEKPTGLTVMEIPSPSWSSLTSTTFLMGPTPWVFFNMSGSCSDINTFSSEDLDKRPQQVQLSSFTLTWPTGEGRGFLGSLRPLHARMTVLWR